MQTERARHGAAIDVSSSSQSYLDHIHVDGLIRPDMQSYRPRTLLCVSWLISADQS